MATVYHLFGRHCSYQFTDSARSGLPCQQHRRLVEARRNTMRCACAASALSTCLVLSTTVRAAPVIHVNQVAFDARGPKMAILQTDAPIADAAMAAIVDNASSAVVENVTLGAAMTNTDWAPGKSFYRGDFSSLQKTGTYRFRATVAGAVVSSEPFQIAEGALVSLTFPSIVAYYKNQRATSPE